MHEPLDDPGSTPKTAYDAGAGEPVRGAALDGDIAADVAVIGGGFVGCSAALTAAEHGLDVVLLERHAVGWGSAGRNAGQVSAHCSKLEPPAVLATYGETFGRRMNAAGAGAPELVAGLAEKHGIDIGIVRGGILTGAHRPEALDKLRKRAEYWQAEGADVAFLDRAATAGIVGSEFYAGAVLDRRAIAINPVAFVRGLGRAAGAAGARIFHSTAVTAIERQGARWRVATPSGAVTCDRVLLCTNAYTGDLWPGLKQTVIPVRGYQIWSRPLDAADRGCVLRGISAMLDTRRLLTGMRLHRDGRLQFSGGIGFGAESPPDFARHIARVRQILPSVGPIEVEGWWSGWVTRGIADGWRLHELAPGLTTAIGCNGRGVAMGVIMGRELARHAAGTSAEDLVLPLSRPRRVPGIGRHRPVAALMHAYFGWKDRQEVRVAQAAMRQQTAAPARPA